MQDMMSKKMCDRCGAPLPIRIMSWFTEDIICMDCSSQEDEIKDKLRKAGKSSMEGCGYVPKI